MRAEQESLTYILAPGIPRTGGPLASPFPLAISRAALCPTERARPRPQAGTCCGFYNLVLPDRAASLVNIDGGLREERENKGRFIYDRKRNQQEKKNLQA